MLDHVHLILRPYDVRLRTVLQAMKSSSSHDIKHRELLIPPATTQSERASWRRRTNGSGFGGIGSKERRGRPPPHSYNPNVKRDSASNPLTERYASKEMAYLFSSDFKFRTWRRLWIALAEAEKELGLPITDKQIAELKAHAQDINYEDAERREREIRHDVMSHIYAYGLAIIRQRIVSVMAKLRDFAWKWRATPQLAFTHFQPAQLTTIGKRASLWLHELLL